MFQNQNNAFYNGPFMFMPYKPSQESQIKNHMEKISGGLLIAYLVITVVTVIFTFSCPDMVLDMESDSYGLFMYILNGVGLVIGLPVGAFAICKMLKTSLSDVVEVKRTGFRLTCNVVIGGLGVCMLANYMIEALAVLFSLTGIDMTAGTDMMSTGSDPFSVIVMLLSVAILPAFVEELIFRGAILGSLRKFGDSFAIIISAVLFGLLHGNFVQTPFAFVIGLVLGYVTVYCNSIVPAMIIHFLNNGISVGLMTVQNIVSEETYMLTNMIVCLVLLLLSVFAFIGLMKHNKDFLILKDSTTQENSLKARIKYALTEPWTIVFTVLMVGACLLMLLVGAM